MYMYCHHRKTLQRILKKQGIDFKMNTKVTSAEREAGVWGDPGGHGGCEGREDRDTHL